MTNPRNNDGVNQAADNSNPIGETMPDNPRNRPPLNRFAGPKIGFIFIALVVLLMICGGFGGCAAGLR